MNHHGEKPNLKTLICLYPGCIEFEVYLAAQLLSQSFPSEVATPNGEDHKSSVGIKVRADLSFENIQIQKYKVVLIPGGDPGSLLGNLQISKLLKEAHEAKLIIGAICAGPFLLAQAGILKGKTIAHGYQEEQLEFLKPYFKDVKLTENLVYRDGHIVTAKPNGFIDFALEIALLAGVITDSKKVGELRSYYQGAPL